MPDIDPKPLIACSTTQSEFAKRIENAVTAIGGEFYLCDDLATADRRTFEQKVSCVVYDFQTVNHRSDSLIAQQSRERWSLIVAVPRGDVKASFHAASLGAVNVIEKPLDDQELKSNLQSAQTSEMRVREFLASDERRFCGPVFETLTRREKSVLRLLMEGESNKCIAAMLDMGLRTVECDRANMMKKLQVGSYVDLIKMVTRIEKDIILARRQHFNNSFNQTFAALPDSRLLLN